MCYSLAPGSYSPALPAPYLPAPTASYSAPPSPASYPGPFPAYPPPSYAFPHYPPRMYKLNFFNDHKNSSLFFPFFDLISKQTHMHMHGMHLKMMIVNCKLLIFIDFISSSVEKNNNFF